jgi:2,4-dienoyl-CoA reductase-like NADH-dependent reductase (Old Yellow Enzyme family)
MDRDPLAQPLALRPGIVLRNRIAKSAMSEQLGGASHEATPELARLYRAWSDGGAGLLITGNVMVDGRALGEPGNVVVEDERHLDALRAWSSSAGDTPIWMQINHPGRQIPRAVGKEPVAPSAVPMAGLGTVFAKPRALLDREIREIIERFATTAMIAEKARFKGVQIHAAHGYLISQFLSPRTNLRTDRWGGAIEARMRFLMEIIRAIKSAVSSRFAIGVKLNSADFQRGAFSEEESIAVVQAIEAEGIDLLEISGGTYERTVWSRAPKRESTRAREAYFLDYVEKVRDKTRLLLMLTGGFRTADAMRSALVSRAVDVVGLARPLAAEPDLPTRILEGRADAALPVKLRMGITRIDDLIEATWYQRQIRELASGRPARPTAGRLFALQGIARFVTGGRSLRSVPHGSTDASSADRGGERALGSAST